MPTPSAGPPPSSPLQHSGSLRVDALVIGSGPAGAAGARRLAQHGFQVALVDRREFPRDKACGDALIPDALQALARLGLRERVLAQARTLDTLRVYAPNRGQAELSGEFASVPRAVLDDLLRRAAVEAGARFLAPYTPVAPLLEDETIAGATMRHTRTGELLSVSATVTLLATGAASRPLDLFRVCQRPTANAMAARLYVETAREFAQEFNQLYVSFDRRICPGYGWIFPLSHNTFNVGVGYFADGPRLPPATNLRALYARFATEFPPLTRLLQHATSRSELKGAPLRTGLSGAALSRSGLLVIGEAAGLTYPLSGEGIGKAIESALLAADLGTQFLSPGGGGDRAALAEAYASRLRAELSAIFDGYGTAQAWMGRPWLANLLAWRARSGRFARQQLEGLLAETADPGALFSPAGLIRALVS